MITGELTGTRRLARVALRRDRVRLPVWLAALTLVQAVSASSVLGLYPTGADLRAFATSSAVSPVALATNGLVSGASGGAVTASQTLLVLAVGAALMSTLLVVRHTRQNEETGRAELVGAAVVGRHAMLTAALAVAVGANVVLAVLNALVLVAQGLPVGGSFALGGAIGGVGIAFAGVGAVAAQLPASARGANGLAAAALGVAFLLRAVGDIASTVTDDGLRVVSGWPSWLSPIGWGQQVRPYDADAWWLLGLLVACGAVAVAGAFALTVRRDVGTGLLATRPGPARAAPSLRSPLGLAWRLQRGVLLGWAVAVALVGIAYGAVGDQVEDLVGTSEGAGDFITELGGGAASLVDAFFSAILGIMAVAVAAYTVQALLRLRGEESAGRLEPVLAGSVARSRWALSHVAIAVAGVVGLLALLGATTGLAYGLVSGDPAGHAASLTGAALARVPAVLVLAATVLAVVGALPRLAVGVAWGALAGCLLLGQIGVLLDLPQAVLDLSPFSHVPAAPAADVTAVPLLALGAVAVVLAGAGLALLRRRDLAP